MAESSLSVDFDFLKAEVAAFLGYGVDPDEWTTAQEAEVERYVQAGVRRFYYPPGVEGVESGYQWSFLSPVTTIDTVADDAAQNLPDDLGRVLGDFFYEESEHRQSVVQVSESRYQALISRSEDTDRPRVARVRHKSSNGSDGQRLEVAWWPIPNGAYTLTYRYESYQGVLSNGNPYPLGGMRHSELVTASCLAVAEQRANDERGIHTEDFERQLRAAIEQDRRLGARHYGHMGQCNEEPLRPRRGDTGSTYPITYNGSSI